METTPDLALRRLSTSITALSGTVLTQAVEAEWTLLDHLIGKAHFVRRALEEEAISGMPDPPDEWRTPRLFRHRPMGYTAGLPHHSLDRAHCR